MSKVYKITNNIMVVNITPIPRERLDDIIKTDTAPAIKSGKAAGTDSIQAWLLKADSPTAATLITDLPVHANTMSYQRIGARD